MIYTTASKIGRYTQPPPRIFWFCCKCGHDNLVPPCPEPPSTPTAQASREKVWQCRECHRRATIYLAGPKWTIKGKTHPKEWKEHSFKICGSKNGSETSCETCLGTIEEDGYTMDVVKRWRAERGLGPVEKRHEECGGWKDP